MSKALILIFITLALTQISEARDWRGIIPLRSTRADVERLLGSPEQGLKSIYQTEGERISVTYSERLCDYGWLVPLGTVINFSVYPKTPSKVADLKLDESKYVKRQDYHVESIYYYINQEEGINYTVNAGGGMVTGIEYYPAAKDNNQLCPLLKDSKGGAKDASKFDEYVGDPADEKQKLDKFATLLRQDTANQGYVMVYAGRRSRLSEAELKASRIKNYLVKMRAVESRQIVTLDGGHREQATVELYLVPPGAKPPLSTPTLKPQEAQIFKDRRKRRGSSHKP